jgi:uncharacterized Tic20 family protein
MEARCSSRYWEQHKQIMTTSPTTEERIWAVLSHLSALAFGIGLLIPVIGWSEQRRKSKYASFQCLQALGYQSLGYTIWLLFYLLAIVIIVIVLIASSFQAATDGRPSSTPAASSIAWIYVVVFGSIFLYTIPPIIAAVSCAMGKDFRYPIMGDRLGKYLGYRPGDEELVLVEEHEDRWVAAMGHFSVIILLWGIVAPATAWILQGKRSAFLKFQSIQTIVYQVLVTLLFFGAAFIYFFGFLALFLVAGFTGGGANLSSSGMVALTIFIVLSLIAAIIVLVIPVFHILGQWAGYRVLKGDNYRYPIIGKLVEQRITKS